MTSRTVSSAYVAWRREVKRAESAGAGQVMPWPQFEVFPPYAGRERPILSWAFRLKFAVFFLCLRSLHDLGLAVRLPR